MKILGFYIASYFFLTKLNFSFTTAFQKLAKTRGTNVDGAVPANTVVIFAIGMPLNHIYQGF